MILNRPVLSDTEHEVTAAAVLEYRKVMGLPLPEPGEGLDAPAVLPFNPEIRHDTAVIESLGLDFSRTLALGIDIDVLGPVRAGDILRAETVLARDERTDGNRFVDVEATFSQGGVPVRRWTLHLIEQNGATT